MEDIPIPFVDEDLSTDPSEGSKTFALVVAGFAVFAIATTFGNMAAQKINQRVMGALGMQSPDGSNGVDII